MAQTLIPTPMKEATTKDNMDDENCWAVRDADGFNVRGLAPNTNPITHTHTHTLNPHLKTLSSP